MSSPMDMMGGGPPPDMGGGPPGGPPPSLGGEKSEPTVDDLISALRLLPMEARQQIAEAIVGEEEAPGAPPSLESPPGGSPMEDIARARAGGGGPV